MEPEARAIVVTMIAAMLPGIGLAQATGETLKFPSCTSVHRNGRRIVSNLDIVEFVVPRSAHVKKARDVDYEEFFLWYGKPKDKLWMNFMFGALVGDQSPRDIRNPDIHWTSSKWGCHNDDDGTDWRGVGTDGRRWRHVSIPFGFANYEGVPVKAAEYFDRILDSMCCGKCQTCKKWRQLDRV
jgi:hypothetical protein